jgi:AcrR family transcriptional regulator
MIRIVKEHAIRRNEILDVAQEFVDTKGYEQMTIQDILNALQIAKGTFYHYFDSKQSLLEALIERILDELEPSFNAIVNDPQLPALEKLQRFFATAAHWKAARKAFMLELLRIWYMDENTLVRQKVSANGVKRVLPLLTAIIYQGIREGSMTTPFPDMVAGVIMSLLNGMNETIAELLLSSGPKYDMQEHLEKITASYSDALERVLGISSGLLRVVDVASIKEWADSLEGNA